MKNKQVFAGMLALVLVFGLIAMGCPTETESSNPLQGTMWTFTDTERDPGTRTFYFQTANRGRQELRTVSITADDNFTYSVSGNEVTITFDVGYDPVTGTFSETTMEWGGETLYKQ